MVYHFPGSEPFLNNGRLGPLRLLTSDELAAQLIRRPSLRYVIPFAAIAYAAPNSALRVFLAFFGLYFASLIKKWSFHSKRNLSMNRRSGFFWTSDEFGKPPTEALSPGTKGVLFNKKQSKFTIFPSLNPHVLLKSGFQFGGLDLGTFLWIENTVGIEYMLTSAARVLAYYTGFTTQVWDAKHARHQIYLGLLNVSLAVHVCNDRRSPSYRNIVIPNCRLPYEGMATRVEYKTIEFVLDHDKEELVRCVATWKEPEQRLVCTETYGDAIASNNTHHLLSEHEQLHQVGLIGAACLQFSGHVQVHWWANSTNLVTSKEWPMAGPATAVTEWMNGQAMWGTAIATKIGYDDLSIIFANNGKQGVPLHKIFPAKVLEKSKFHQMAARARTALMKKFQEESKAGSSNLEQVYGIVAATIMHSADHWYLAKYFPLYSSGSCILLKSDMSGGNMTISKPIAYNLRRSLVRQNLSDPICQFADHGLAIGCTV